MAVPTFVGAGAGAERLTTGSFTVSKTGCTAGNLVILQMRVNGTTTDWGGWSNAVNIERLDGTDNNTTGGFLNTANAQIRFGRVMADGTVSADLTVGASGEDIAARIYEFSGVSVASTLAGVVENGAGVNVEASGTGTSVADADVTTNGADRLALALVALDSAQAIGPFTGETGGDWSEAVAEYVGTTLTLQLQIAALASAGTIDGGAVSVGASTAWSVIGTALIPPALPPTAPVAWIRG